MGPQDKTLPQLSEQDKCCRTLMNELASDIAELSFLHEDSSHELRTKLRACQTTAIYRTCSLTQNFRTQLEGPEPAHQLEQGSDSRCKITQNQVKN